MNDRVQAYLLMTTGMFVALGGYASLVLASNARPGILLSYGGLLVGTVGFIKFREWQRKNGG